MSVIVNPKKPAQPQTEGEMTAKRAAAETAAMNLPVVIKAADSPAASLNLVIIF